MKKKYVIPLCFAIIVAAVAILIGFYLTQKTRYIDLAFFGIETASATNVVWAEIDPAYIEVSGLRLKGYPNETTFTDERIIKKITDYLSNIPLVYTTEKAMYSDNIKNSATLMFYNEKGNNIGWVRFQGEEYMLNSINMQAYKVRDKGMLIISGLEALNVDEE